jgi:hypothetical protein
MISGFRSADGLRLKQQTKRRVWWHERDDGMIDFRARLPKEDAALLLAAIDAAKDQFGPPPPKPDPCSEAPAGQPSPGVGVYSNADALLDVARVFLDTAPQDRSGEDRTLVVVHVSAEQLGRTVPAGTPEPTATKPEPSQQHRNVPAGTPDGAVCHIEGVGSVDLHACVQALFTIKLPEQSQQDQQAA